MRDISPSPRLLGVAVIAVLFVAPLHARGELRVSSDFESGSAEVLGVDQATQTVRVRPAGDAKRGMPSWWFLRVDGVDAGKAVVVEVEAKPATMPSDVPGVMQKLSAGWAWPARAAVSSDGVTWKQTEPGERRGDRMVYRVPAVSQKVWLAWGPPFGPKDATALVEKVAKEHAYATAFTLCQSLEGRAIPAVRIREGDGPATTRPAVWVQARQHAWEVGGSWVSVGFTEWLVSSDEHAVWLRQHAEVIVVPIMDVDHVATGDGGKNALPQDQNRDWTATPHWPEVAAAQKQIAALAKENRMSVFLDLHNPGPGATKPSFYVLDAKYIPAGAVPRQARFLALATEELGEINRVEAKPPAQNPEIFDAVSAPWASAHGNADTMAFCIETPWNTEAGTTEGYRAVGRKLGRAVERLMRERAR